MNHTCALADPRDEIRITGLELIPVNSLRSIFVTMRTDAGITGIGEGTVEGRIPTGLGIELDDNLIDTERGIPEWKLPEMCDGVDGSVRDH